MNPALLQSIPFLRDVEPTLLGSLAGSFAVATHPRGALLIEENHPIEALYIVCRGAVHARRRSGSKEILLGRIGVGGFFGEINLFVGGGATASIHVVEPAEIASIPHALLRRFLEDHPAAGYRIVSRLMEELCDRLRRTNAKLAGTLFWNPRG